MADPTFETLLYSVEDGIATITLNRPEKLNAFTARMMSDMSEAFDITDADDAVKAVIVTGGAGTVQQDQLAAEGLERHFGGRPLRAILVRVFPGAQLALDERLTKSISWLSGVAEK